MSGSVEGAVGAAVALQQWNTMQEKENTLLRKVLDNQGDTIMSLVNSVPSASQLSASGSVGTLLHVTA